MISSIRRVRSVVVFGIAVVLLCVFYAEVAFADEAIGTVQSASVGTAVVEPASSDAAEQGDTAIGDSATSSDVVTDDSSTATTGGAATPDTTSAGTATDSTPAATPDTTSAGTATDSTPAATADTTSAGTATESTATDTAEKGTGTTDKTSNVSTDVSVSPDVTTEGTAATGESESTTTLTASGTTSTSASALDGIDISGWQPDIDLSKVAADFVIIKATEGTSYTSDTYQAQASAALTAGDLIGFYHFYSATSGSATDQASYFTSAISSYIGSAALVLDWEADAVSLGTSYAKTWLDTVYGLTGVSPLIYMSKSVSQEYDWTSVAASYKLWVAQYADMNVKAGYQDDPWHSSTPCGAWGNDYTIFKYSSTTRLSGYSGNLDVNKYYGTASDWASLASSTRQSPVVENADATGTLEAPEYEADLSISGLPSSTSNAWFAVWSLVNNQDDIVWYAAEKNESNAWTAIVIPSDHGDTGVYEVHCYAILAGKLTFVGNTSFTVSELAKHGWVKASNGIEHYTRGVQDKGWIVTAELPSGSTGGLQRYWIGADGYLAEDRLVTETESGRWAYAESDGIIARGKYTNASTGYVYLADNDGGLADPGWVVADYGDGLQRYWVDSTAHACMPGYSAGGWAHYTTAAGYVLRGSATINGVYYLADNDGLLASGWVVTSDIGSNGLQRYWFEKGTYIRSRLIDAATAGWWAYATAAGYVVRGSYVEPSTGYVYLADNDGKLAGPGWVVADYGDGLQRYWVDATAHACVPGYSTDGWAHYTTAAGYVLRGSWTDPATGYVYLADNDGLLAGPGWVVADYGDGLQRYWVDATRRACVPGYSKDGWAHYTLLTGYVLRGSATIDGVYYQADNDGLLAIS